MKNVAVGKKIFIGFGAVILMIVVLLAVTLATSFQRSNQLDEIKMYSEMNINANSMLDLYNESRIQQNISFETFANSEATNSAIDYISQAEQYLNSLGEIATANKLENYMAANTALTTLFNDAQSLLGELQGNDANLIETQSALMASMDTLAASSSEAFNVVTTVTADASNGAEVMATRITDLVMPAQQLSEDIDSMRVEISDLLLLQDTSAVGDFHNRTADFITRANALADSVTAPEAKAALQELAGTIQSFDTALDDFASYIDANNVVISNARAKNAELAETVNAGVASLDADVQSNIESIITTSNGTMIMMTVVTVIAILFGVAMAVYLGRAITGPLGKMKSVLVQAGTTGDLNFSDEVRNEIVKEAAAKDELGQSIAAFAAFVDRVRYIADNLEKVANRDLTIDVDLLSDRDTMGLSLRAMVDNLNDMFHEINSVSSQVATSSGEIAVGAQSLAQGSTEQASTVEEISASINEINEQSKVSVTTASEAADYGNTIRSIAQEGNDKMGSMMQAVQEINNASQAIGQVIKVIDDIAFQTNILALNAAVEAARAGEHGKGFAVVADEVRNLAGKSADAAKETSTLISANIEKAELGLSISQETAESLKQIVEGIQQTSESLKTVAEQAEGSQAATAQVNLAVDQVAQVVQQNSATSEESAAASEEMSSQAQVLQQLIARFKLKGVSTDTFAPAPARQQLPAASSDAPVQQGGDIIF